jgi:hypothetical protein
MIVHTNQAGIARPGLLDQLADARYNAVVPWKLQLSGIGGISIGRAPSTVFEKCRMHGLTKHTFHRAGSSMLGTVFSGQIQSPVRTLTERRKAIVVPQEGGNEPVRKFESRHSRWQYRAAPLDPQRLRNGLLGDTMQAVKPFTNPAILSTALRCERFLKLAMTDPSATEQNQA